MHINQVYQSAAFRLLAQGMKDREAVDVVVALMRDRWQHAFRTFERWAEDELREQEIEIAADLKLEQANLQNHVLFKTGEPDTPDCIKDRNGHVVLNMCRVCGKGEAELSQPCDTFDPVIPKPTLSAGFVPKYGLGDRLRKKSGTWWEGKVVGFYSTKKTPVGYAIQLEMPYQDQDVPVQIYPETAVELIP